MKAPVSAGGDYELIPEGNHAGILVGLYYVGTQKHSYQGEEKDRQEVIWTFELPNLKKEFKEGEGKKPYAISKRAAFSMGSKAGLRKVVQACVGTTLTDSEAEAFEVEEALGKACLVNVSKYTGNDGKEHNGIDGVSPLIAGMEVPAQVNPSVWFDVTDHTPEQYENLPKWIKDKVDHKQDTGLKEEKKEELSPDDIPF